MSNRPGKRWARRLLARERRLTGNQPKPERASRKRRK